MMQQKNDLMNMTRIKVTVLPAKSDSDVMFYKQSPGT